MQKLKDKIALVTGGSRGMGAAIVKQLAQEGASVVFTYVNGKEKAQALIDELTSEGLNLSALKADNAVEGEITSALTQTIEKFGQLDILVNNAGVYGGKPMEEHTLDDYRFVMDINVKAVFEAAIFAAQKLEKGGRFITIGSNMADRVVASQGTLYSMSKSALSGLTRGLARDLGPKGITVNLVQPGPVNTDMNPADGSHADHLRSLMAIPKYGDPQQIAEIVGYLASPSASFTTGSIMTIDGGFNS
ncbi:SDR family oxidoreductase [Mucilaginibacter sp. HC2]|uniref:SDR family NAD(P)-dependent oxidoreductase n=1 Tax=Mucilaginibacter inviolabilis TaxID=2714892 RepID=UPI00140CA506|nr:SDR family oxidoreductase [Mucilaginibacter inviolabilis]NHA07740.1 SDR family oxidoreductase [Mucilaginibacter inviolabilis]